jgi:hypothetical protein
MPTSYDDSFDLFYDAERAAKIELEREEFSAAEDADRADAAAAVKVEAAHAPVAAEGAEAAPAAPPEAPSGAGTGTVPTAPPTEADQLAEQYGVSSGPSAQDYAEIGESEAGKVLGHAARQTVTGPIDASIDAINFLTDLAGYGELLEPGMAEAAAKARGFDEEPETQGGQMASEAIQFVGTMAAGAGALKLVGLSGRMLALSNQIPKTTLATRVLAKGVRGLPLGIAGAGADFVVSDPAEGRLSDMAAEFGLPAPDVLLSDPDDSRFEARLKNVAEGGALGAAAGGVLGSFVRGARFLRGRAQINTAARASGAASAETVVVLDQRVSDVAAMREYVSDLRTAQKSLARILDEGATDNASLREAAEFRAGQSGETLEEAQAALLPDAPQREEALAALRQYSEEGLPQELRAAEEQLANSHGLMVEEFTTAPNVNGEVLEAYRQQLDAVVPEQVARDAAPVNKALGDAATERSVAEVIEVPALTRKIGNLAITEKEELAFRQMVAAGDLEGAADTVTRALNDPTNFERLAEPDGIKNTVAAVAEAVRGAKGSAKQSTRTLQRQEAAARKMLASDIEGTDIDLDTAVRIANELVPGTYRLSERVQALRIAELGVARHVNALAQQVDAAGSLGNELLEAEFTRYFRVFAALNDVRSGAVSEVARTLGGMNIRATSRKFHGLRSSEGRQAIGDAAIIVEKAGGKDNVQALAREWLTNSDSILAQRSIARTPERTKLWRVQAGMAELARTNMLSGLKTFSRNATGNGATTATLMAENLADDAISFIRSGNPEYLKGGLDMISGNAIGWKAAFLGANLAKKLSLKPGALAARVRQAAAGDLDLTAVGKQAVSESRIANTLRTGTSDTLSGRGTAAFEAGGDAAISVANAEKIMGPRLTNYLKGKGGRGYSIGAKVTDIMATANRWPFHALATVDELTKSVNYEIQLRRKARHHGIASGKQGRALEEHIATIVDDVENLEYLADNGRRSDDHLRAMLAVRDSAEDRARNATFTDDYNMGKLSRGIENALNKHPVSRLYLPFTKTPTAMLRFAIIDRSPVGLISKRIRDDLANPETAQTTAVRMVMGTAMFGIAVELAHRGLFTGDGPTDHAARQSKIDNTEWRPNSIVIPREDGSHTYVNIGSALEPIATFFNIAATYTELTGAAEEEDRSHWAVAMASALALNLKSKSYYETIEDAMVKFQRALDSGEPSEFARAATSIATMPLTNLVPQGNLTKSIKQQDKPKRRRDVLDEDRERSLRVEAAGRVGEMLPFEDNLKPVLDMLAGKRLEQGIQLNRYGEPVFYDPGYGPDIASPFYRNDQRPDPVRDEFARLGIALSTNAQFGSIAGGAPGEFIRLTPDERADFTRLSASLGGTTFEQAATEIIESEVYANEMTDVSRKTMLQELDGDYRKAGLSALFAARPYLLAKKLQNEENFALSQHKDTQQEAKAMKASGGLSADLQDLANSPGDADILELLSQLEAKEPKEPTK